MIALAQLALFVQSDWLVVQLASLALANPFHVPETAVNFSPQKYLSTRSRCQVLGEHDIAALTPALDLLLLLSTP